MSKYLSVNQDGTFGFKDSEINQILDTDVQISDDIYNQFFQQQAQGKQFKIGNLQGTSFTDIFVEFTPTPGPPTDVEILQQQNAQLLLASAQQAQTISDLQTQNAAIMLQLAQIKPGGTA